MIAIKRTSSAVPLRLINKKREIFRVIGSTDVDGQGTTHEVESNAYGCSSPIVSDQPILYMHIILKAGATKILELDNQHWNGFI